MDFQKILEEGLVDFEFLTPEQFAELQQTAALTGRRVIDVIQGTGLISPEVLTTAAASLWGVRPATARGILNIGCTTKG